MFLPTTPEEISSLGWDGLDVILVTGDTYIDSSYIGVAVIGRVLLDAGYRVGIIAQPDTSSDKDISRLGLPGLFWGVTAGCMDSMVSNYTASRKRRNRDDLTPGGKNTKRPDLAVIVYANLIRRYFKDTPPIIIGGMEASLRRISHYHFWSDSVRRSILFDSKADVLVYGMGEKAILELAESISHKKEITHIRGICYAGKDPVEGYIQLPSHREAATDKARYLEMFRLFYQNADPVNARGLCQKQDTRYLIHNPPQFPLTGSELDKIYEFDYERDVHPFYKKYGHVRALETIRYSITTHRGCYGECSFCAISIHQGRTVVDRSESSIIREAEVIAGHSDFKGIINDVGGATANMYGMECPLKMKRGACRDRHCLTPEICSKLPVSHKRQINLLRRLRKVEKVKKVFISSGIRHDLVLKDKSFGIKYLEEIVRYHISGQLKTAPEHSEEHVLRLMAKPYSNALEEFKMHFDRLTSVLKKKLYLTCYFIAAHPGCTLSDMHSLRKFINKVLKFNPEQVQIFTPSPLTWSTSMYYTETDPETGGPIFVEKDNRRKEKQKNILFRPENRESKKLPRKRPSA
ncbi:MAG: YgiQ family radical SAM protein [Deltaproteobacteria bacterium]|nr:YgiQ family radical SAM protein [Deltaproteobacteria bacterium]